MSKRDELAKLNEVVEVGLARLAIVLGTIERAKAARVNPKRLIRAYHKFANALEPVIERRNQLLRETDERLS